MLEHLAHVGDKGRPQEQLVEREHQVAAVRRFRPARLVRRRSGWGGEDIDRQAEAPRGHLAEVAGDELVCLQVDHVDFPLRELADFGKIAFGAAFGGVQGHDPRVVVVRPVHRPRAQPEHQPHHAGRRVDALVPDVGVAREGHAGHLRIEEAAVADAGDPLHQQRHLLVAVQQPPLGAVAEGLLAHRAGVDRLHRGRGVPRSRRWCGPWLGQKTLSYLPAKALP